MTGGIRFCLIATAGFLLLAAAFCLLVLAPQKSNAPSIRHLREQWRKYIDAKDGPPPQAQIAEGLLHGQSKEASSPLDLAFREANRRGRWFSFAVLSLGAALLSLTALVVQVFWQMWGGVT